MLERALVLAAAFVGLPPAVASAYDALGGPHPSCPEGHLPAVCCFEPAPGGFTATLCGRHSRQWSGEEGPRPRIGYRADAGWTTLEAGSPEAPCPTGPDGVADAHGRSRGCPAALLEGGAVQVGSCVEAGGYVWFGVAFYDGEGETGTGGVGRLDPRTGRVELRRPAALRPWSSAALLHDGRFLWLATYRFGEGGDEPAIGVVRYDWARDRLVAEPEAMCGFLAKGMVKVGDAIWLASDGGLSRRTGSGGWEHFVVREGPAPGIRRVTCREVLDLARRTVRRDERSWFEEQLAEYRSAARSAASAGRPGR